MDIILTLNLPEFQPAALDSPGEWHDLMATRGFKPGAVRRLECDGRGLFVHRAEAGTEPAEEWRVYDSRCPHQTTDIPHLALAGTTLTCPKHEWAFDIRSGACIAKGDSPLKRWPSKVAQGRLLAHW